MVSLDINNINKVLDNSFPKIKSNDSGIIYYIQKILPAVKSLYKSVVNWESVSSWHGIYKTTKSSNDDDNKESVADLLAYEEALDCFLNKAVTSIPTDCRLIIFYHPETLIDENGDYIDNDTTGVELFRQLCDKNGIIFIDETKAFRDLYNNDHILAHGFSNTSIGVGHLNESGHQVIANSLAEIIKEMEK